MSLLYFLDFFFEVGPFVIEVKDVGHCFDKGAECEELRDDDHPVDDVFVDQRELAELVKLVTHLHHVLEHSSRHFNLVARLLN